MNVNNSIEYDVSVIMVNQSEKTSLVKTNCPVCRARFEFFEDEDERCWRQFDIKQELSVIAIDYTVTEQGVLEKDKVKCYWCGANLQFNQGQLSEEISEGEIKSLKDGYKVKVHYYQTVFAPHSINWPKFCMLCMKPVTFQDFYDFTGFRNDPIPGQYGRYRQEVVTMRAPYCSRCRGKIKRTLPWGREEEALMIYPHPSTLVQVNDEEHVQKGSFTFTFRNKTYAGMFREMNVKSPDETLKDFLSRPRRRLFG